MSSRSAYLDAWKGIAAIAVIAIHATGSALGFPEGSPNWTYGILSRQVFNFAVPLFLALAGYLSGHKRLDTWQDARDFWVSRFSRLIPPYIVWSVVTLAVRDPSVLVQPLALLKSLASGSAIGIGYYVVVLLQFVAVTPLLARIKSDRANVVTMVVVALCALASRYYFQLEYPESVFARFYSYPLFMWYPFYHLGFYVRRRGLGFTRKRGLLLGVMIVALGVSLAEGWLLGMHGQTNFGASQIKFTSFVMSGAIFLLVLASGRPWGGQGAPASLAWFGRNSYFVYLTHLVPLAAASRLLDGVETLYAIQPVYVLARLAVAVVVCGLAALAIGRLAPRQLAMRWLGVDPLRID